MIRLLLTSLRFYWRSHVGVLLGAALATAVLTGSLLVGDSVDGSLRKFALQRLGGVELAMHTPNRFFAASLAERIADDAAAVLQLRGMAMTDDRQINQVQVAGCDSAFWKFAGLDYALADNEVALNAKLASALAVAVGDTVSLRIEKPGLLPREAPLSAQKVDRSVRGRFKVVRVLGDDELGRFSLSANQVVPHNAFVNRGWLEEKTEMAGKANLLLAGAGNPSPTLAQVWAASDFGLRFREAGGVVQLESENIYLGPEAARAAMAVPGAQGSLTYLVNSISNGDLSTPYSFVLAKPTAGMADDEIIINQWLSEALGAGVGDGVTLKYFELLPNGEFEERERAFKVVSIFAMDDMELERQLAPGFPGLTDVDRCSDWDVGIPMDESQLEDEANEAYWNQYKQTPKAIVSLTVGQEIWSNRFGNLTGVRWAKDQFTGLTPQEAVRDEFDPAAAGYVLQPVREQALASVENAMDFGQLFVGMSFFLIVAALMLTGLLFVFGIQNRAEEMGILLAMGWTPVTVRRAVLVEGGIVALIGSVAGAGLGIGYTKLLIAGLSRYWSGAIANSAIEYFGRPGTVAIGAVASLACAMVAMAVAVWRQAKHPARKLLSGSQELGAAGRATGQAGCLRYVASGCAFGAVGIAVWALVADVQSVTMPFFGAGALLLVSGVLACGEALRISGGSDSLSRMGALAMRNVARRRGRSLTVVGLLACGTFLVFAVSSMKEDVTAHADEPWSGSGGFAFFGESTLPITDGVGDVRLRVRDGDDASCLNLNRARTPRLLGVDPAAMSGRGAFCADEDVWQLLNTGLPEGVVPALVGDADTAMWGLEAKTGIEKGDVLDYVDEAGHLFKVKLVGKLPMRLSVFQGSLLVSEEDFAERFPSEEGYRMFLFDGAGGAPDVRKHERSGLDVVPATERLLEFYAVESTYLAMFLVLGALGLAVGSLGMGVTVLRNVQDRRAETALLRAVGFRDGHLRKLLFIEHGVLMLAGLVVGIGSAAVAMVPALFITKTQASPVFLLALLFFVVACGAGCMAAAIGIAIQGDTLRGLRNE
jgi:ABC-type lipoprotein release transport system permease subunit